MSTLSVLAASTSASASEAKARRWLLPSTIGAAFAIRLVVVFFNYRGLPDADKLYERFGWEMGWIARAIASGCGFSSPFFSWSGPTAMQPPLYPALLAVVFRLFGIYSLTSAFVILTVNSIFSALTCIPVYFSAKYSLGSRVAKIAAWAWAFYPFAIYFSADRVWEYSLTALLFTTCFCIAQRIHRTENPWAWLGWGVLYGVTALSNPAVLSVLPFLWLFALWQGRSWSRRWIVNGALTVGATLVVLTPWTVRNDRAVGILCPVRDNFWHEFYSANFGNTSDLNPVVMHPASNPAELQKYLSMGERAYIAQKHVLAIQYLSHHPLSFAFLTLRRLVYYWTGFWSLAPGFLRDEPTELPNIFYCCGITLLMLRGLLRLWRFDRISGMPYVVLVGIFPLLYYATHPLMDYRQPIEPAILVLAVAGALPWRLRKQKIETELASFGTGRSQRNE